jgi:hypothetical protein
MPSDKVLRSVRLSLAFDHRDWRQAKQLIEEMHGDDDGANFAYGKTPAPINCYSILLAKLEGEHLEGHPEFIEPRQELSRKLDVAPTNAGLLSNLAVMDALLGRKRRCHLRSQAGGRDVAHFQRPDRRFVNLAIVYARTNQPDLAFEGLETTANIPHGLFYNYLKLGPNSIRSGMIRVFDNFLERLTSQN